MSNVRVAVFASGTGSNFEVMMQENLPCDIVLLVSDQAEAVVLEKAARLNVPTFTFDADDYPSKAAYEKELVEKLRAENISWIFLAGYMRLVGPALLDAFPNRIINIHPSLLPAFPGKDAIGDAFAAGVDMTGVTVHYIDEGIDTGPIIKQKEVPVLPNDTRETLQKRVQAVEYELYPEVIRKLVEEAK